MLLAESSMTIEDLNIGTENENDISLLTVGEEKSDDRNDLKQ